MAEEIPVPAEAARQLAIEASKEITRHREEGRKATARSLEREVAEVFNALEGKDGEFVSLSSSAVSSITAESSMRSIEYAECARVFLEQYDVW
jgi:hypothetical protein